MEQNTKDSEKPYQREGISIVFAKIVMLFYYSRKSFIIKTIDISPSKYSSKAVFE